MLAIKLRRIGKKHQASFRVVVMEKRSKLNGRFVDDLGWLNPHTDKFELNKERARRWLKVGAQPTDTVHNLFVKSGILSGPKIPVHKTPKKTKEPAMTEAAGGGKEVPPPESTTEIPKNEAETGSAATG